MTTRGGLGATVRVERNKSSLVFRIVATPHGYVRSVLVPFVAMASNLINSDGLHLVASFLLVLDVKINAHISVVRPKKIRQEATGKLRGIATHGARDATNVAPGLTTRNKKLLGTSATLVVTSALLVLTRSY